MTVAVGAGSRGLTGRVELLRGTISGLRELGAEPFVVPAMGSHGGATADGQRAVLAKLGMTEAVAGRRDPLRRWRPRSSPTPPTGGRLYLDAHAAAADRILPVNRDQAAHRVQGSDRERLHEDGRRRLRQAARGRRVPRRHRRRRCATTSWRASPRCAAPAGCSAAWRRSSRRSATSSPSGRCGSDDVGGDVERRAHGAGQGARRAAAVRRHRRARHRARRQGHLRHDARPQRHRPVLDRRHARPRLARGCARSSCSA